VAASMSADAGSASPEPLAGRSFMSGSAPLDWPTNGKTGGWANV